MIPILVPEYSSGYVFNLSKKLEKIHEVTKKPIALSNINMKLLNDRSKRFHSYNAGDVVWFYNPLSTKWLNPKLQRDWQGLFLVYTEIINDVI